MTDRGRPVARLVPVETDQWQALLASGRVIRPSDEGDLLDDAPSDYGINASAELAAIRDDER